MWLLESDIMDRIDQAIASGMVPTIEQETLHAAGFGVGSNAGGRILALEGSEATINISGVITNKPDFMAMLMGGGNTTYPEIISAIAMAEGNPSVTNVKYKMDSLGGHVSGMFDTIAAMQAAKKPSIAVVGNNATSATYALAAQADKIVASGRASKFGSIGIMTAMKADRGLVTITSTNAPKKRPDITTDEGVAVVREELDAMHELFVEAIAEGRNTTVEKVNAEFGRGGTFLADEALKRGMIDSIAGAPALSIVGADSGNKTAALGGENEKEHVMDKQTLQAQHPLLYAEVLALGVVDGQAQGQAKELDRVGAHLAMGEASGDMVTACAAIKDGSEMTATLQATYMAAGMNRKDIAARGADAVDATAGDTAAVATEADKDALASAEIMKLAATSCGVTLEV